MGKVNGRSLISPVKHEIRVRSFDAGQIIKLVRLPKNIKIRSPFRSLNNGDRILADLLKYFRPTFGKFFLWKIGLVIVLFLTELGNLAVKNTKKTQRKFRGDFIYLLLDYSSE